MSLWNNYCKHYMEENNCTYREAMKLGKPGYAEWKKSQCIVPPVKSRKNNKNQPKEVDDDCIIVENESVPQMEPKKKAQRKKREEMTK